MVSFLKFIPSVLSSIYSYAQPIIKNVLIPSALKTVANVLDTTPGKEFAKGADRNMRSRMHAFSREYLKNGMYGGPNDMMEKKYLHNTWKDSQDRTMGVPGESDTIPNTDVLKRKRTEKYNAKQKQVIQQYANQMRLMADELPPPTKNPRPFNLNTARPQSTSNFYEDDGPRKRMKAQRNTDFQPNLANMYSEGDTDNPQLDQFLRKGAF